MTKMSREEKRRARQEKLDKIADVGKDMQKSGGKIAGMGCLLVIFIPVVIISIVLLIGLF